MREKKKRGGKSEKYEERGSPQEWSEVDVRTRL